MTEETTMPPALRLERTFDCAPDRLFRAWTDPHEYARWLNPAPQLDLIIHEWDARPGGRMRFDMPQPDGNLHPQSGMFHEIDPPRRIVTGEPDRSFLIEATFEALPGKKTRLVIDITGLPPEWHEPATTGWNAGFDKLEALVTGAAGPVPTRTLELERMFDCTPQALWDAWTDPAQLAKWFGPMPESEVTTLEARPGGTFRLAMVDDAGERYPVWGTYQELEAPHRLVFTAEALEIGGHMSTVTVEIEAVGDRTRLRLRQDGLPTQVADDTGAGWRFSWDKLARLVTQDRSVVISRHVKATRERVWRAFTEPDEVAQWWGPDGFSLTTKEMDVRVGGTWVFTMHGPDGTDFPNWIRYEEVLRPERLAYAHGGARTEPEFHGTTTFTEEDGGTLVTLYSVFPNAEARDHVVREFNAIEGGKQTLGRLAKHVEPPEATRK